MGVGPVPVLRGACLRVHDLREEGVQVRQLADRHRLAHQGHYDLPRGFTGGDSSEDERQGLRPWYWPLLLQVRTRVLNDDLADDFRRWHPGFTHTIEGSPAGLAVAA